VVLAVNKADNAERSDPDTLQVFERLGFGAPHPIAAINNEGLGDLLDLIVKDMSITPEPEPEKKSNETYIF
jgi:predicted GTPase